MATAMESEVTYLVRKREALPVDCVISVDADGVGIVFANEHARDVVGPVGLD